jgi:hypothetical protein
MRGTSLIATAAAIGVTLLVVSCGQQHAPGSGTAGVAPSGSAQARCVTPKLTSPGRSFTITDKDNGKSFCVTAGTGVFIFLHGAPVRMWAQIKPSSAAIQPRPSGKMTLARGVTGGYFVATRTGAAFLMSVRTPCHVRTALASASHCTVQSEFRVKLVIRGKA